MTFGTLGDLADANGRLTKNLRIDRGLVDRLEGAEVPDGNGAQPVERRHRPDRRAGALPVRRPRGRRLHLRRHLREERGRFAHLDRRRAGQHATSPTASTAGTPPSTWSSRPHRRRSTSPSHRAFSTQVFALMLLVLAVMLAVGDRHRRLPRREPASQGRDRPHVVDRGAALRAAGPAHLHAQQLRPSARRSTCTSTCGSWRGHRCCHHHDRVVGAAVRSPADRGPTAAGGGVPGSPALPPPT